MAVEVGVEVAEEGAAVVAPRARRRHPPVDAEDVVDGAARAAVLAAGGIGSRSQQSLQCIQKNCNARVI
jgi:hypothetical protein